MSETVTLDQLVSWMRAYQKRILDNREYLTELDAQVGDADHGSNMVRGVNAVVDRLAQEPPENVSEFGKTVGMTFVSSVGGASGPLYGTFFLRSAIAMGDKTELSGSDLVAMLQAGVQGVQARGKAKVGDKTMVDVLVPALNAAENVHDSTIVDGVDAAVQAARDAVNESKDLVARKGRASYLGQRSAGHIDPGSASSLMLFEALADVVQGR
ncbi:MAG: dihydroxyacetone kinase subunit DhaL [Canibacter sp.]